MSGLRLRKSKPSPAQPNSSSTHTRETEKQHAKLQNSQISPLKFTSHDYAALIFLTFAALLTRFYRIASPRSVVFDELHFSKFVDRVLLGVWFFDIHPPLGKLILAYVSYLLGYRPEHTFVIEKIGNDYPEHVKFVLVRGVSASFSVATVPLTYLISRNLLISPVGSTLAAAAVLFDFLGIIEGRLILMDSQLLFFCQLALLCAFQLWRTQSKTPKRIIWLLITGAIAGAAFSIKHTALATPGLIAVISFFGLQFLEDPLDIWECGLAALSGFVVYAFSFFVMFSQLWKTGGKYDKFMPSHFQKTLIGAAKYEPDAKRKSFWRLFVYLNRRMLHSNANIKKRHNWESDWYHWIVNWRGVLFYLLKEEKDGVTHRTQIYLFGNPVVTYLALLSVVSFIVVLALTVRYRKGFSGRMNWVRFQRMQSVGVFLLSGWLCNLLPYILVDRAAFIYHYLPGLFYAQLLGGLLCDMLSFKPRVFTTVVLVTAMFAAFLYWSPWIYAFPMENKKHVQRRWLPRWT